MGKGKKTRLWSLALLMAVTVVASAAMSGAVGGKGDTSASSATGGAGAGAVGEDTTKATMAINWKAGVNKTKAFEIKDFSFGVENPTTIGSATGGAGAGKIKFNEFQIKKTTDSLSPRFFESAATGQHLLEVTIELSKVDKKGNETPFMQFKFETVFTTKIDWSGPGDEGPEESITFVYGKLVVKYIEQDPATGQTTEIVFGWDQVTNNRDDL